MGHNSRFFYGCAVGTQVGMDIFSCHSKSGHDESWLVHVILSTTADLHLVAVLRSCYASVGLAERRSDRLPDPSSDWKSSLDTCCVALEHVDGTAVDFDGPRTSIDASLQ